MMLVMDDVADDRLLVSLWGAPVKKKFDFWITAATNGWCYYGSATLDDCIKFIIQLFNRSRERGFLR